jgi:2-phosphoglycerate kinase
MHGTVTSRLAHVLWLGGSACAGKSSVARLLSARHGLALYSCDDHFEEHRSRASPERHPRFHRLMDRPVEELWSQPAEEQASDILGFYQDEMEMVREDLSVLSGPVLAEGVGLLPRLLAETAVDPRQTVWLVSSEEFRLKTYRRRGPFVEEMLARCSDPERTFREWMRRDSLIAEAIVEEARRIGRAVIENDGRRSVGEVAAEVARRLGLPPISKSGLRAQ